MYELPIKFDTRVLCAQAISSKIFLFGTLSSVLYAYDIESRQRLWELRVHDAVLCLNFLHKEKDLTVFAGLADGNLAVIEGVSNKPINQVDILYTSINSAPVTALLITGTNLWCASANRIFVLSALTLDSVCTFMLSKNPYDVVRCMKSSEHGIWITVKGSSSIELWDPVSMTCKMKYDIKTGQYPYPQEDEEHLNMQRVTWLLPHRDVLWISDRPIGCLLETIIDEKPLILSFSGFYGDDEPVLQWTQESSDKMWTNEPLQEICPITKVAKPYSYMKNYYQINKRASSNSQERRDSIFNQYQSLCRRLSKTF
ncbi:TBC1D2B [Acanthosepion pharaonis]|uniref:TBC1D2B n=1 Tax=Acanthosepion pharaonis TaxID=158019 RepID=A0A812E0Y1_ACAPH|nr:TBC1D2B [Sepia pharaonis]